MKAGGLPLQAIGHQLDGQRTSQVARITSAFSLVVSIPTLSGRDSKTADVNLASHLAPAAIWFRLVPETRRKFWFRHGYRLATPSREQVTDAPSNLAAQFRAGVYRHIFALGSAAVSAARVEVSGIGRSRYDRLDPAFHRRKHWLCGLVGGSAAFISESQGQSALTNMDGAVRAIHTVIVGILVLRDNHEFSCRGRSAGSFGALRKDHVEGQFFGRYRLQYLSQHLSQQIYGAEAKQRAHNGYKLRRLDRGEQQDLLLRGKGHG